MIPINIILISSFFGCIPITLSSGVGGKKHYELSPLLCCWNVVLFLVITVFLCFQCYVNIHVSIGRFVENEFSTTVTSESVHTLSLSTMCAAIFFGSLKNYKIFIELCAKMEEVDELLTVDKGKTTSSLRFLFVFPILFALCFCQFLIRRALSEVWPYYFNAAAWSGYFVQAAFYLQFMYIFNCILDSLRDINLRLKGEIQRHIVSTQNGAYTTGYKNLIFHLLFEIFSRL